MPDQACNNLLHTGRGPDGSPIRTDTAIYCPDCRQNVVDRSSKYRPGADLHEGFVGDNIAAMDAVAQGYGSLDAICAVLPGWSADHAFAVVHRLIDARKLRQVDGVFVTA